MKEMFSIQANNKFQHTIDGDLSAEDILKTGPGQYHLLRNGKSYNVEILNVNIDQKIVQLKVGDQFFDLSIADQYDALIDKMGLSLDIVQKVNDIKAPMPGLVLSIEVKEGQEVGPGDPLLVLEAMKMENVIKSSGEGIVKAVLAEVGKPVDKGAILIEME